MGGKQGLPSAPEPEHETGYGQLDRAPVEGRGVNRHSDGETAAQADSELGCFHGAFCFMAASMACLAVMGMKLSVGLWSGSNFRPISIQYSFASNQSSRAASAACRALSCSNAAIRASNRASRSPDIDNRRACSSASDSLSAIRARAAVRPDERSESSIHLSSISRLRATSART